MLNSFKKAPFRFEIIYCFIKGAPTLWQPNRSTVQRNGGSIGFAALLASGREPAGRGTASRRAQPTASPRFDSRGQL
jgi:hypothetical protein